jgi:hypothetical protein
VSAVTRDSGRRSAVLALVLWFAGLALLVGTLVVILANSDRGDQLDLVAVAVLVFVLSCTTVGALVAARRPDLPIGWLLLISGVGYALAGFSTSAVPLVDSERSVFMYLEVLSGWLWGTSLALVGVYLLLRFPNGQLLSRRWRIVEWITTTALVAFAVGNTFNPGHVEDTRFDNPMGIPGSVGEALSHLASAYGIVLLCAFAAIVSIGIRYRRSRGTEREQLKWIVYAAAVIALGVLASTVIGSGGADSNSQTNLSNLISTVTISFLPVAIGIAILRHRLWDIDRIINRTIVYTLLTLLLLAVYAALVVGLGAITGRTGNPVVIAGSTLVVAALFGPARRRIQGFIDRRFYRRRYDAERVLAGFSSRLRDELELETLSSEINAAVSGAMQPRTVGLWIRPTGGRR